MYSCFIALLVYNFGFVCTLSNYLSNMDKKGYDEAKNIKGFGYAFSICNFGYIGLIITLTTMSDSESLVNKGFRISTAFYDYSAVIFTSKNKKYNRIRIKLHTSLYAKIRTPMSPAPTSSGINFILRMHKK